jgi:PilZ domain
MSKSIAQARPIRCGTVLERRRQPRVYLPLSVRISSSNSVNDSRFACLRDANIRGAFFFCDLNVAIGETLYVHLATPQAQRKLTVNCEATVVRVEKQSVTGSTGVAVEFHRFEVEDETSASLSSSLNWNADGLHRMFAQQLELERCAFRKESAGAA